MRSAPGQTAIRLARLARLIGATAALWLTAGAALAQLAGSARVIDGDTLEISGERVRLFGIDAPALDQICPHAGRDYPCGKVARAALWDLVAGRDVNCAPVDGPPAEDGSIPAICSAGEVELNERMVHAGWARADAQAPERFAAAQAEAERARRGLWRGKSDPSRE